MDRKYEKGDLVEARSERYLLNSSTIRGEYGFVDMKIDTIRYIDSGMIELEVTRYKEDGTHIDRMYLT